jgi:hypothetical protein
MTPVLITRNNALQAISNGVTRPVMGTECAKVNPDAEP